MIQTDLRNNTFAAISILHGGFSLPSPGRAVSQPTQPGLPCLVLHPDQIPPRSVAFPSASRAACSARIVGSNATAVSTSLLREMGSEVAAHRRASLSPMAVRSTAAPAAESRMLLFPRLAMNARGRDHAAFGNTDTRAARYK
ncbi:hypothetical protein GUJ93_ZPchr0012g18934 [Zizania palustris]|uniref:Uncharacterized protein n=1 Tax=Zizania palustris TaxID=103762 RepID=A0A8J5WNX6_ZIZPA|nr:hypothetical protein GUJ93_ZPchr0012g18934 [Zizania palustris]